MTKKNLKDNVEELQDEDYSSEDMDVYKPTKLENEELVVEEDAYNLLEYIDLEWPSQTVDIYDSRIFLGTCPNLSEKKTSFELLRIDLKYTDYKKLDYEKTKIDVLINKIRISKHIFALSDSSLLKFDLNLKLIKEVKGMHGFALYITPDRVFVGSMEGYVTIYSHNLDLIKSFQAHNSSIESICFDGKIIYTGSTDHSLKMHSLDGILLDNIQNDCDINCVDVMDGRLAFGDDKGVIGIYNVGSKTLEKIEWHSTPINFIRWKDNDIFACGSDEQLCLWDITLEEVENQEYPKYLLFVHQGQRNYKDCCFEDNKVIVTTEDGVCVFEPISLVSGGI